MAEGIVGYFGMGMDEMNSFQCPAMIPCPGTGRSGFFQSHVSILLGNTIGICRGGSTEQKKKDGIPKRAVMLCAGLRWFEDDEMETCGMEDGMNRNPH